MDEIELELSKRGIKRGGTYLLSPSDALDVVKRCRELNIRILGIDAFKLTDHTTQPVLEHSVDFSLTQDTGKGSWFEAETFIKERFHLGLMFEIVCE
ncbi:MAG: hypothetical protein K6T81_19635 [Alicyclobacillus macrosporangiidus]|uniref:hypothetical protein n=1 Tax=Alicyclobacillus macrosporangiidus TaxID=392015 RepID=UPI0026EDBC6B|nr:hypothetical protein [Alicyclobacillus macrosporangiidus]MCL6600923.1 hypothetical protein [Alicyclobacillus macrosporangiidus]